MIIDLERSKDNKIILQKNISSAELIMAFIEELKVNKKRNERNKILDSLKERSLYTGRSSSGSINTMGVRLSEICFYMFGYIKENTFVLSSSSDLMYQNKISKVEFALTNLFSLQFPNPYSNTSLDYQIYLGRLILKLLTEERINYKLYIDEIIWFLPFMKKINIGIYEDLIKDITQFRNLNYSEKVMLFRSVENSDDVFSNCMHEWNYYFLRMYQGFDVLDIIADKSHNDGKLLTFKHGNCGTIRSDAFKSRAKCSGYVQLNDKIFDKVEILLNKFKYYDIPESLASCFSREDWLRDLYEFNQIKYLEVISESFINRQTIVDAINNMVYQSKYGTRDGKSFEESLKPVFGLFRQERNSEIISGSGNTDLLCVMENENESMYKINVDAKTSKNHTSQLNGSRLQKHIKKHNSEYCIVVSPKFSKGVKDDIKGYDVVTIEAETLANYCLKECLFSTDGFADFNVLDEIVRGSKGNDITKLVNRYIELTYGSEI